MFSEHPIYLDYAATTPTDPQVVEAMLPYFTEVYGNPSSSHNFGRQAERAIENARGSLAKLLGCNRKEIIFTSCATESDNMALRGPLIATGKHGHIITTRAEHHAVSHTAAQLGDGDSVRVTWLPVDHEGRVTVESLDEALRDSSPDELTIVSLMYANNEVGTLHPIRELAALARVRGALFHCDAVQVAGQLPLDLATLGVDMLSLTAHKFYGPKGVGMLYVRQGVPMAPAQSGGGQEAGRRAGTHNVPLIVGMAKAFELACTSLDARAAEYRRLRDQLIDGILSTVNGSHLTGAPKAERLPNHASFVFENIEANSLLMHLDMAGIAASSGSACNTGSPKPSDALTAMGYPEALALSSLRLTVGRHTSDADIDRALEVVRDAVGRLREVRATQSA